MRKRVLCFSTTLAICLVVPATIDAQLPQADSATTTHIAVDSGSAEEGWRTGRADASQRGVAGRAVVGFIGGIPLGVSAILFQRDVASVVLAGAGIGIVEGSWRVGSTKPPLGDYMHGRGEAFRRGYAEAYRERLLQRRKWAARLGGVAGFGCGVGLLIWALSQITI